ncbi:Gfo/Idh/MocA family protein [Phenylobacterium montanum]|uniref:Gfo/Idh/MocA family oxidoreductase n=1 Tax=Phenylobacterium montanum TaxID=2823693 RepID=A0A975FX65_9CAUL|nr:Gfo/Idh/MocA family oxidoreductase [Caulobacter sp. S6]QUD86935.1 Gfo/Idh/MocA family oxidoreductase [Caulobacter sp. S6]
MKTYRIGVIGLGQRIAHVLAAMAEVGWSLDLAGYADPMPIGLPILDEAGIAPGRAFADEKALLAAGPFDLVMIGSPNHLHLTHLLAAFEAGWPIFAEKPIVRTEAESCELARRLARGGVPPLHIGLVMRSMPIVREVIARVDGGQLGQVVSIDATEHLPPEHGGYLARNWRRRQDWGGSYLLDKVCHDFDIFGRLAGARAERVASFGGRRIFTPERAEARRTYDDGSEAFLMSDPGWAGSNDAFQSDMDVTDHQVALVEYQNGVRLAFHSNTLTGLQERRWYIAGTEATLLADLVRNKLMIRSPLDRVKPERIDFGNRTGDNHNGADQAMALDLLASLEGRAAFPVTAHDSLEAGLTVMAIDRAMDERRMVECAPMWAAYDAARKG